MTINEQNVSKKRVIFTFAYELRQVRAYKLLSLCTSFTHGIRKSRYSAHKVQLNQNMKHSYKHRSLYSTKECNHGGEFLASRGGFKIMPLRKYL